MSPTKFNPLAKKGFDKIGDTAGLVSDTAYGASWDGVTTIAPSKNAVYDKIQTLAGGHDAVTLDANADTLLSLSTQELGLDTQVANTIFAGPASGADAVPTFRALVADDIPDLSGTYLTAETDPDFNAWLLATPPLYPGGWYDAVQNTIGLSGFDNDSGFITSFDDEKVKYDAGDPTAGYVADKIIAGTGISVAEGTGANENKLVVTSDITQYTDSDAIAAIQGDASWNASDWDTAYGWGNHASAGYVTGTPWTAEGYLTSISGESIGSLSDVVDTGKDTGKVLKYNAVSGDWEVGDDNNTTYTSSDFDIKDLTDSTSLRTAWSAKLDDITGESIGDLSDVNLTGIAEGKVLKANALGNWVIGDDNNTTYVSSDFDHDALTNFVANEHIDWTNTSEDLSTTGDISGDDISATGILSAPKITADLIGFLDYTMFDNFNKNELHNAYYRGTVTYTLTGAGIVPSESNAMFDGVEGNRLIISGAADNTTELTVDIELDEALDTYTSAIWQPFVKFRSFTSYSYFRGIEVFVSADGISYVNPSGDAWKTTDSSVDSVYSGLWFGSDGIPTGGYPIKYIRFVFTDHYNTYSGSNPQCVYISEIGLRHKSAPFSRDFVQAVNGKHWGEHNFYPAGSTTSPNISLDSETGDITAGDISGDGYNITGVEIGQTDGLVAFWSFDEANKSIIYDRSNSGNDATPQGFSWNSTSGYVDGHLNKSLKFDGTDNWVQAPLMSEISATKDYTISVWIKPKQSPSPGQYMIYQNTHGGTDRNGMNIEEDDVIKFGYYNGSYESVSSDTITALGGYDKWYHIVGINDGGVASLYVNGVKQTGTSTFYAYTASDYMYIGKTSNDNNYYKGEMDEFAVYNRALSEEEVLDLYYGQKNKHQLINGNWLDREKGGRVDGDIRASNVDSVTGYKDNGTAGIDTTFLDANGNTIRVSGGIITAKTAP